MARTYTKLVYHIVFSTKERMPLITGEIRERLYPYLGGVIRGEKGSLMEIGGVADHVHILARFGAAVAVSENHKRVSFKEELIPLLRKHGIEFDEEDLLD